MQAFIPGPWLGSGLIFMLAAGMKPQAVNSRRINQTPETASPACVPAQAKKTKSRRPVYESARCSRALPSGGGGCGSYNNRNGAITDLKQDDSPYWKMERAEDSRVQFSATTRKCPAAMAVSKPPDNVYSNVARF